MKLMNLSYVMKNMEPRKQNFLTFSGTALLVSAILVYTHSGSVPMSYDFGGHISRIYILLHDGMGWTDIWYNGYAFLKFYPPLYYLVSAPVAFISMDLVRPFSFGLVGVTAFVSMYYYAKSRLSFERSLAAGVFFLSGWFLYIIHVSGSMPQGFAAALAPAFYAEMEKSLSGKNPAAAGVLGATIILFHHNAAIAVAIGAAVMILLNRQENIFNALSAGALSLFISGFWILPALLDYSETTYSLLNQISVRGLEDVILVVPIFGAPILAKLIAAASSANKYRKHAVLAIVFMSISVGYSSLITSQIPVISNMPPYRFYLVTAFAVSFMAAAAEKRVMLPALTLAVIFSLAGLNYVDDSGFQSGQEEAYEYLRGEEVELLYDSEDTDIRAYALKIHGKDIADGWSIGSTSLRPGLKEFWEWQKQEEYRAVDFLNQWEVSHVISYRDSERNIKLHRMINESESFKLENCFSKTCIFEAEERESAVLSKTGDRYVVNASKTLPIPYSNGFNVTAEPDSQGFMNVKGEGRKVIEYQDNILMFGFLISILGLISTCLIYSRNICFNCKLFKKFR